MTIAFKSSWKHAELERLIKELDTNQDVSRSAFTNRAIDAATDDVDWVGVKNGLAVLERRDIPTPPSMQAKPDDDRAAKIPQIKENILNSLKKELPEIQRIQTPYFMQLIWMNYLNCLRQKKMQVGKTGQAADISGPDMVKRLVQILLLNRQSDQETIEKIKEILLSWEE